MFNLTVHLLPNCVYEIYFPCVLSPFQVLHEVTKTYVYSAAGGMNPLSFFFSLFFFFSSPSSFFLVHRSEKRVHFWSIIPNKLARRYPVNAGCNAFLFFLLFFPFQYTVHSRRLCYALSSDFPNWKPDILADQKCVLLQYFPILCAPYGDC